MRLFQKALLLTMMIALTGCISIAPWGSGRNRGQVSPEIIEEADRFWTYDQVLVIPLTGFVGVGSQKRFMGGEPGMLVALKDRLKAAERNPWIKAIVLKIDSPGGGVTASDLIYREIKTYKEKTGVPVVALMTGTAASGGFYVAMAADEVYALPTTVTGSIGVMMALPGMTELGRKIGFEMRVIKSGDRKDGGSPWSALATEDREIFQSMIDDFYQRFLDVIMEGRNGKGLTLAQLKAVADGRVLTARQAMDARLIDGIKYHDEVIEQAKTLAEIKDAQIITYEYPFSYRGHIYAQSPAGAPQAAEGRGDLNLINFDFNSLSDTADGPQFMYMWVP